MKINDDVMFAVKWGLVLGLALFAAQQIASANTRPVLFAPVQEQQPPVVPIGGGYVSYIPPVDSYGGYCQDNPGDPLCTTFGGPGGAWI